MTGGQMFGLCSLGSHNNGAPDIPLPRPQHERSWGQVRLTFNIPPVAGAHPSSVHLKPCPYPLASLVLGSLVSSQFTVLSINAFLFLVIAHVRKFKKFVVRVTP